MNNHSDIAAGASYVTSIGSGGYWLLKLLDLFLEIANRNKYQNGIVAPSLLQCRAKPELYLLYD
ncbi:hypothetical protein T081_002178 [Salmonella enterica subsp. enterica serovar Monophasic]|nr:hypothetical protein [Salmonella enterica subsp. enterica serovar Monophasic]